ncbi:hypothetical protein ACIBIZ_21385 [Nonomuraea spiralis]|uniref:hypothetical protein n=1 Tax=Nonomuraea spiralis TaxID=46182 RepID=UPI0037935733
MPSATPRSTASPEGILIDDDGTWLVPIVRGWSSRSDADAEAYLIANNRSSEKGGWEERMLAEVLADVRDADEDVRPEVWGIIVTCDNEGEQTRLLERLADEGWQVRALM